MAQAFLIQKSGGGINQTLPPQVTAFHAQANSTPAITLTWTNPTEHFGGVLIVKKIGTAPTSPTDGEKIYSGADETFTDADVQFDTEYFYRAFAYNEKKQYQTLYAVASAKPVDAIPLSELAEGTLININEGGTAVPFYLAKHDYESGLNGAGRQLMVRKDYYSKMQIFNGTTQQMYKNCNADIWCNNDYKALFGESVQEMMGTTKFYYTDTSNNFAVDVLERPIFTASLTEMGLSGTRANVEGSILPIAEILFTSLNLSKSEPLATRTGFNNTGGSPVGLLWYINYQRVANSGNGHGTYCFRPCFTLPATALVNPTPNADGSYTLIEEVA